MMNRLAIRFVLACVGWISIAGCGGNMATPSAPVSGVCTGLAISGTMLDSLTNQPVSQGWAVLESGSELATTPIYNFSPTQKVSSDAQGGFSICAESLAAPSALVLVALDASAKAYPAFVAAVSGAASLGKIPTGGCTGTCGLEGQQQTSSPATIKGAITSAPIAATGTVVAQYTMNALDGTRNLWNFSIPDLDAVQSNVFSTTAGACAGNAPFCAQYTFAVPSQKPVERVSGGYVQQSGAPVYSIYAVLNAAISCTPAFGLTAFQQDGKSPLNGVSGVQLSAADIQFTACK